MPLLRLAYITQFLIALIAVFVLWSEVGGQSHLDLMPWYWKLALGGGSAFAAVKATMAAVGREKPWNGQSLRWLGVMLALLACCGLASYYAHLNEETDQDDEEQQTGSLTSELQRPFASPQFVSPTACSRVDDSAELSPAAKSSVGQAVSLRRGCQPRLAARRSAAGPFARGIF